MREIRQSGSEGGVVGNGHPYPYTPGCSHLFCSGRVPGLALGIRVSTGAPRDRSCPRRERWGRLSFRAVARGGSGCRRSNACSGPVPLPLGGSVVGLALGVSVGPRASVQHIYTKGVTLTYFQVMRDRLRMGWFWCVLGLCSAGSVLRAQGSSGEDGAFALCARGRVDRFQCLLRPVPAAASGPRGAVPHV
jgi:hypothetical protein